MNDSKKQSLLRQIAAISAMEPGKLSTYAFKERSGAAGPYHKLQHWDQGKNKTRYVPAEALPQIQAAVAGYQQYLQLTTPYANLVIQETREAIADSKKTKLAGAPPRPRRRISTADRLLSIPGATRNFCGSVGDLDPHGCFQICQ